MELKDRVAAIVFETIDELNDTWLDEQKLEKSKDADLLGSQSKIDSMAFISFIVVLEGKLQDEFNSEITLSDENTLSIELDKNPFRKIGTLIEHINILVTNVRSM